MLKLTRNQPCIFPNELYNLYKDEIYTDFIFYCANGEKVKVHGVILIACSQVFKDMLKGCQGESYFIKLMNSENIVRKFIDLIYLRSTTGSHDEINEVSNLAKIYSINTTENDTESFETALEDTFMDEHFNDNDSDNTPDEFEAEVIDVSSGNSNESSKSSLCFMMEEHDE